MAAAAPAATRTVVQHAAFGPSSVLQLVTDAPVPPRKAGQVLVANKAAGMNPVDYKMRIGFGSKLAGPKLPNIPGGDIAGEVLEADAGSAFKPGDRVMGLLAWCRGGYASKVVVPEADLARIPDSLSFEQAASLPLVGLTSWQALDLARVKPGDRVLIHAGAGGVGSIAIQLAKVRGLNVTTTCSTKNVAFCKELGADEVCDYTQHDFVALYRDRPFDAVLDTIVLRDYEARSMSVLKRSGTYVHFMPAFHPLPMLKGFLKGALGLGPRFRVVVVHPDGKQLSEIAMLVAEGKVKPIIAGTYPLASAAEAQDELAKGHTRGKLVLVV